MPELPFPMGGRISFRHFPEAPWLHAVLGPERLTERCCSFGVRGWRTRDSPARGRYRAKSNGGGSGTAARSGQPSEVGSADLAVAVLAPRGELVLGAGNGLPAVGTLAREIG